MIKHICNTELNLVVTKTPESLQGLKIVLESVFKGIDPDTIGCDATAPQGEFLNGDMGESYSENWVDDFIQDIICSPSSDCTEASVWTPGDEVPNFDKIVNIFIKNIEPMHESSFDVDLKTELTV